MKKIAVGDLGEFWYGDYKAGDKGRLNFARAGANPSGQNRQTRESGGKNTAEFRNKRGTCYTQMMTVARAIQTTKGKVSLADMRRHGIWPVTIRQYFPDLDDFFRALNIPTTRGRVLPAEALKALRGVAETVGRTPVRSDLRRFGLPSEMYWRGHFGSYSDACRRAGLDPNLPIPDGIDTDVAILTSYALYGTINKVARHLGVQNNRVMGVLASYGAPFPVSLGFGHGTSTATRREWAADMARRLAGEPIAA